MGIDAEPLLPLMRAALVSRLIDLASAEEYVLLKKEQT
jgi:hypothetical protein